MLLSLDSVQQHCEGHASAHPSKVADAIAGAEGWLATWLGYPRTASGPPSLALQTYTDLLNGPTLSDRTAISVQVAPIVSVTTVHQSPTETWDATSLVPAADYSVDTVGGRIWTPPLSSTVWYRGRRSIRVVYVAGWTSETILDEHVIVEAVGRLVGHLLALPRGARAESASRAGSSVQYRGRGLPRDVADLVGPYRLAASWGIDRDGT